MLIVVEVVLAVLEVALVTLDVVAVLVAVVVGLDQISCVLGHPLQPIIQRCSVHDSHCMRVLIALGHDHGVLRVSWQILSRSLLRFNVSLTRVIVTICLS